MSKHSFDLFNLDEKKDGSPSMSNQLVGELALGAVGVLFFFFFTPAVLVSVILTLTLNKFTKKTWEWGSLSLSSLCFAGFIYTCSWRPLIQFGCIWRFLWNDGVHFAEQLVQDGRPFTLTCQSWMGFVLGSWCLTSVCLLLYRKLSKTWLTHEKEEEKRELLASDKYKATFRKKNVLLEKRQQNYRESESKKVYIGMTVKAKDVFLTIQSFFTHCFIQGTTGSGKTALMYAILEGALRNGLGAVFIDGKGDPKTEQEIRKLAQAYQKKLFVFSDRTDLHYNPVRFGKATAIKDRLMATLDWSESFYEKESENMLQMIINFVQDYVKQERRNEQAGIQRPALQGDRLQMDLKTIHRFLDMEEIATYLFLEQSESIIAKAEQLKKKATAKEGNQTKTTKKKKQQNEQKQIQSKTVQTETLHGKYIRYFFSKSELTYGDIEAAAEMKGEKIKLIQGLRTQLELLLYSDLGEKFLEHPNPEKNLDLFSAIRNGHVVLVSLNSNDYSSFIKGVGRFLIADVAHCVTKLYQDALRAQEFLAKGGTMDATFYQGGLGFFDEFGSYGSKKIIDIVSKARSADFGGIIGAQSIADLVTEEGDLTGRLIDNINLFFMGRSNDPDHAEYTSRLSGTYADIDRTVVTENQTGIFHRMETKEDRGTVKNVRKFVFDPDTVKELPNHTFLMVDKTTDDLTVPKEQVYTRNVQADL